ncbi:uncharacterized protein LOC120839068 [Ixodes scapularis]|uniref:uncharacterized protein LOC120839068 n=1 Tax=Ixodes scapularis TaxID=6945 RepID=UPI001A9FF4E3|nr:uncharacterized protein LOC120839068 [Ixodes scapularis]
MACVHPYGTAVGRANGFEETTIAYIFTFIPLIAIFFKPACGFIVDRTQNATAVLIALQTIALVSFGLVFTSQYIQTGDTYMSGLLSCSDGNVTFMRAPSSCTGQSLKCNFSCRRNLLGDISFKVEAEIALGNRTSTVCKAVWNRTAGHEKDSCDFTCPCQERSSRLVAFYLYVVFVVLAYVASGAVYIISDAALCELLGDNAKSFGHNRLWGTLGYGVSSPLVGFFIDEANKMTGGRSGYTPGVVLFAIFLLINILLLCLTPRLTMKRVTTTFFRDVKTVFYCLEVIVFALWTCLLGSLFAFTSSFNAWLMEDIGSSKLTFACSMAFASYAASFIGSSFVRNPWYTLLAAIPNGIAFSMALSSITVFAKEAAPPGTTTFVMCILNILGFEGIGAVLGSLVGGTGFGKYGGRAAFRYAGIAAFTCAVLCLLSRILIRRTVIFIVKPS